VRLLAARGWRCVLIARREDRLRTLADEVDGEYEVCDVGERAAVERAGAAILERHPKLKLLVNNAGIPGRWSFLDAPPERIEELLRVNYLGGVWCLRALLPALEAGRPSDVVNIVSVAGAVASSVSGPYTASKHAQLAFSRSIGPLLRGRGIRVHTILPGFTETEGFPQRSRLPRPLDRVVLEPSSGQSSGTGSRPSSLAGTACRHSSRPSFRASWEDSKGAPFQRSRAEAGCGRERVSRCRGSRTSELALAALRAGGETAMLLA
jgi:NAD(P)-dependent dehydrogenase (short-subunit alcohol dehydrogenase family)